MTPFSTNFLKSPRSHWVSHFDFYQKRNSGITDLGSKAKVLFWLSEFFLTQHHFLQKLLPRTGKTVYPEWCWLWATEKPLLLRRLGRGLPAWLLVPFSTRTGLKLSFWASFLAPHWQLSTVLVTYLTCEAWEQLLGTGPGFSLHFLGGHAPLWKYTMKSGCS